MSNKPIEIIPAIMTGNISELKKTLETIDQSVDADGANIHKVQIDIIDGEFADNKTIDPANMAGIDTNLSLDFHLMVKEPINWVEKCANAGADRIIGQIEMMHSQKDFVDRVQEDGLYVGLALDLETPVADLDPTVLNSVDVVLLMAVKAGWGGQKFDSSVLTKIKELDKIRQQDSTPFKICVDGGETEEVIDDTHHTGADEVVIGKRLFQGSLADNVKRMQEVAD